MGIDLGTSGTRVTVIDDQGEPVHSVTRSYSLDTPRPGWAEQDPQTWIEETFAAIRELGTHPAVSLNRVKAIGPTGQMHSSVFLDDRDRVLRPAILWCDQRTAPQCEDILKRVGGLDALIRLTANRALPGFTAPKILWVRDEEPEIFSRVRTVLVAKDYLRFRLTGTKVSEVTDASGTLLFDVASRTMSGDMIDALDLDPALFPDVVESPAVTGQVHEDAASQTGLPVGVPVVGGAGDQAAAAVGNSIVRPGSVTISLGTSGVVFAATQEPLDDREGALHVFCHAVPSRWHAMGVMLSAGGAVSWWRNTLSVGDTFDYRQMDAEAASVAAGSDGLLFLPYLSGERTPIHDPQARGGFFGLSLVHRRSHMSRAVMEGVSYGLRQSLELLTSRGLPIEEIRLSGGGAKSGVWKSILADVLQRPLMTLPRDEGPAHGAALLASVQGGAFESVDAACDHTSPRGEVTEPNLGHADVYEEGLRRYVELYQRLKGFS